jgi:hypothetical protein
MKESYLHQAIRDHIRETEFITISPTTFKVTLISWIELLRVNQIHASIWLKLPANLLSLVDSYIWQECAQEVYMYGRFPTRITNKKVICVDLSINSSVQNDFFLVVKSSNFSGLLFAVQTNFNEYKLSYSFEPHICQKLLYGLQDAIAITDKTSLEVLTGTFNLDWKNTDLSLITSLLLRQAKVFEEIEKEEYLQKMQNSVIIQEEFLARLTEEMRSPLTQMKTAICLLQSNSLKVQQRQSYLESIEKQWNFQYTLWNALIEWVKIEDIFSQVNFNLANCCFDSTLFTVIGLYKSLAQEKMITLSYEVPVGLPTIKCPQFYLEVILKNLFNNALTYTPIGGKVSLSCSVKSNSLEIFVIDTGIGIRKNELNKIFNSFYRGHNVVKNLQAVGLGLTIIKQILNHCQGSITVQSTLNQGSIFKLTIPTNENPILKL